VRWGNVLDMHPEGTRFRSWPDIDCIDWGASCRYQSPQVNVEIVLLLGHDLFPPKSFQFIIHQSFYRRCYTVWNNVNFLRLITNKHKLFCDFEERFYCYFVCQEDRILHTFSACLAKQRFYHVSQMENFIVIVLTQCNTFVSPNFPAKPMSCYKYLTFQLNRVML
jgi:hypothetical protein